MEIAKFDDEEKEEDFHQMFDKRFAANRLARVKKDVSSASYTPQYRCTLRSSERCAFGKEARFRTDSHAPFISKQHALLSQSGMFSPGPAMYAGDVSAVKPRTPSVPWVLDKEKERRKQEERAAMERVNRTVGPGSYNVASRLSSTGGQFPRMKDRFPSHATASPAPSHYKTFDQYQHKILPASSSAPFCRAKNGSMTERVTPIAKANVTNKNYGTPLHVGSASCHAEFTFLDQDAISKTQRSVPGFSISRISKQREVDPSLVDPTIAKANPDMLIGKRFSHTQFISEMHSRTTNGNPQWPGPASYK